MSNYMDKVLANMDKAATVKIKDANKKFCKSFEACGCGFCLNYIGNRKGFFQSCSGRCKVNAY